MLLEEAILFLLRQTGYQPVEGHTGDPTLSNGPAGLCVNGRGTQHQVDAVANYKFQPPFSHRYRLLIEGKFYSPQKKVSLEVIRNAASVLRDVSEWWTGDNADKLHRFHYQYAIFSPNLYTRDAEAFAFAHDVYLIPLARSAYFLPVVDAIRNVELPRARPSGWLRRIRQSVRESLRERPAGDLILRPYIDSCRTLNAIVLGNTSEGIPLFLIPHAGVDLFRLPKELDVVIRSERGRWYIANMENKELFSFSMPEEFIRRYGTNERLSSDEM